MINYSGTFNPNGNSDVGVYGWAENANGNRRLDYLIIESRGTYDPASNPSARKKGTISCDGGSYDVYLQYSNYVGGFDRYLSIRTPKKNTGVISGTVTTACHFGAWDTFGMTLGTRHDFQILVTEGYFSSGSSNMTVSGS